MTASADHADHEADDHEHDGEGSSSSRRRRRRRSRSTTDGEVRSPDDPPNTVVRIREPREHDDSGVQGVKGSTRLEAKKQRRREGREQGRTRGGRRGLVITESEFLARRESVDRVMAVRQRGDRTQIGVLEDGILVEHFVSTASTARMVGNVYLGRVQNVLSGMEAAFVDIGKGRNAVLYAGEVNFDTSGLEGGPRRIESALKPGQPVVVQITKDPIGQKGARLTSQISLPGRYLVYVPEGSMMGISRKLPDVERSRLKAILKKVTPEGAGVIVRTAAEGASEEDLTRDVARLAAQWEDIKTKSETADAPALLYSEPDLTIRVIRDVFNEDFNSLIVQADTDWDTVEAYVAHVAPDLVPRLSRWTSEEDIFLQYRVDEQIAKALDRKVWLPSGGYLVIDRTEAMIVIDVNTGRFVGKGGNLEETVTKNNLEAAEEIVRQLRLRDIGGIIVIDFIDMVLEANRDLVLRRLVECLGRDRTKHQVAEVTSLGLVQMTRKRVGNGLLEAFSETCETCNGRGVIVHTDLVEHTHATAIAADRSPSPARVAASAGQGFARARGSGIGGARRSNGVGRCTRRRLPQMARARLTALPSRCRPTLVVLTTRRTTRAPITPMAARRPLDRPPRPARVALAVTSWWSSPWRCEGADRRVRRRCTCSRSRVGQLLGAAKQPTPDGGLAGAVAEHHDRAGVAGHPDPMGVGVVGDADRIRVRRHGLHDVHVGGAHFAHRVRQVVDDEELAAVGRDRHAARRAAGRDPADDRARAEIDLRDQPVAVQGRIEPAVVGADDEVARRRPDVADPGDRERVQVDRGDAGAAHDGDVRGAARAVDRDAARIRARA